MDTGVRVSTPVQGAVVIHPQNSIPQVKSTFWAYVFAIPLGLIGAHHFYLSRPKFGVCYLFTAGLMGVGWLIDLFRMESLVEQANRSLAGGREAKRLKNVSDAYVLWFPLGVFGFHHYYLGRLTWGIAYTLTFGLMGFGWLIDLCRLPGLVKAANYRILHPAQPQEEDNTDSDGTTKSLGDAYLLCATPFGLLGGHHYYMEKWFFGITYTFTLGLLGVGWVTDWCTLPLLFKRSKAVRRGEQDPLYLHLDEAYKLYFPLGILGLHRFYLRKPCTGFLFLITGGGFLIGWIIDAFRIPAMVREANQIVDEQRRNMLAIQTNQYGVLQESGSAGLQVSGDVPRARPYITPQYGPPSQPPTYYFPATVQQYHYPHQLHTVAVVYPHTGARSTLPVAELQQPPSLHPTSHFVTPSMPPSYRPPTSYPTSSRELTKASQARQNAPPPPPTLQQQQLAEAMSPPPYSEVAPGYSPFNQRKPNATMEDIGEIDEEDEEEQ